MAELLTLAHPSALPLKDVVDSYRLAGRRLIILGLLGTLIEFSACAPGRTNAPGRFSSLTRCPSHPGVRVSCASRGRL